jgi:hypothetical protein
MSGYLCEARQPLNPRVRNMREFKTHEATAGFQDAIGFLKRQFNMCDISNAKRDGVRVHGV